MGKPRVGRRRSPPVDLRLPNPLIGRSFPESSWAGGVNRESAVSRQVSNIEVRRSVIESPQVVTFAYDWEPAGRTSTMERTQRTLLCRKPFFLWLIRTENPLLRF